MPDIDAKRSHVRIAAAILAAIVVAATVFTYLSYTAAFTSTDTVTVVSPRAGLVMETDAKVKYRGIQIGEVKKIEYAGDRAKLTLAIRSDEMRFIPANAPVRIAGTTVFGAKAVEFIRRRTRSRRRCGPARRSRPPTSSWKSTRCSRP